MDVQGGTAYLIGRVKDQAELNRVLNVTRTTKGVKKVISHLQISTDSQNPTPAPASQPVYSGGGSTGSYGGATIVNTAPAAPVSSTSGTVEAPGAVSSGDLAPPAPAGH
jgi:hypothetical protein